MKEQIIRTEYSELMQKAYIDYAMSVIVSRAIPDVRDGLKPVQRRTLYDMLELGTLYDRPYRKCARIVGDTMGKYHPHGDSSIYESLVVMAQDFKKGHTLVDGHGNFGSVEGDGAAAMRYTEARLEKLTQEVFLKDMDLDVVDFVPNFDETEKEPEVLPVRVPNILLNGSEGIAVGMATSIPTHNLGELVDGIKAYMADNDITTEALLDIIKGPDFPTGGEIVNKSELPEIYSTGIGRLRVRGKVDIEKGKNGRLFLVIKEIPYTMIGANIGKFLNDVADLVESKKLPEVTDISNQSSKEGIRIVLELKKGSDCEKVKNILYKKTRLEDTFGVNMLAVAGGRPETCSLKKILEYHVDFRFELATRKYQSLLKALMQKKEIQEGLIKACDIIDLIIEILRGSTSRQMVSDCLTMGKTDGIRFKSAKSKKAASELCFTSRQASAILDMRLYRLIGLEILVLQNEYNETLAKIDEYENILNNYEAMAAVIIEDLEKIKQEYARPRRTVIKDEEAVQIEELKPQAFETVVLIDRFGYSRCINPSIYEKNKEAADSENRFIIRCMSDDRLCIFTDRGNMHLVKVEKIPLGKLRDKGVPLDNLSTYSTEYERILHIDSVSSVSSGKLVFLSGTGLAKIVSGTEFDVSRKTIAATKLADDDSLVLVGQADAYDGIVIRSRDGYFLRFALSEIPEKKKAALGVAAIKLNKDDSVEDAYLLAARKELTIEYKDRQLSLNKIKLGKRNGKGVKVRA